MRWVGDEVEEMKWVEMRWTEMRWGGFALWTLILYSSSGFCLLLIVFEGRRNTQFSFFFLLAV
jgi:hypothetical protein